MYLNIGGEEIFKRQIVGIFDLDTATVSKKTRETLTKLEKEGKAVTLSADLPRSFVVTVGDDGKQTVYLSQYSAGTLMGRMKEIY